MKIKGASGAATWRKASGFPGDFFLFPEAQPQEFLLSAIGKPNAYRHVRRQSRSICVIAENFSHLGKRARYSLAGGNARQQRSTKTHETAQKTHYRFALFRGSLFPDKPALELGHCQPGHYLDQANHS